MLRASIILVAFLTFATIARADVLMLAHSYDVMGINPDGSSYQGTVAVETVSDTTYSIEWTIGADVYQGFGMRMNDTLAAGYDMGDAPGLIIYQVLPQGVLEGIWAVRGQSGFGKERLIPRD